jgi:uncharacterized repeat protein (TIGR03803 family)
MRYSRFSVLHRYFIFVGAIVALVVAPAAGARVREKVLYSFTGGTDGASPSSSLLMDASGNLYGTTSAGGNTNECTGNNGPGCGVVFELTPSNGRWNESVLYAFQGGTDGSYPSGNLLLDGTGNIYGTTIYGGTGTDCGNSGCGTVFELSPNGGESWTKKVLHSFQYESDGASPAGLTADASGNLYGVTDWTVYELSPSRGGTWKETLLCSTNGTNPGLTSGGKDDFYFTEGSSLDTGNVSEVKLIGKLWHETDVYNFQGGGNGGEPMAGVVLDKHGNLYGTLEEGGNDYGIAFELKRSAGQWKESMLYNFCSRNNCADGARPDAALVFDQTGNLYGTTTNGGTGCGYPGCGVAFRLAHAKDGWTETVVHNFKGGVDGANPTQGLILDTKGSIYGTTPAGGSGGHGTVFEVTP